MTLFSKVKTAKQVLGRDLGWSQNNWVELFTEVVPKDFNNAIEQWNEETRSELTEKLLTELKFFVSVKDIHKQTIANKDKRELVLPNHEFTRGKMVTSRQKNLKWNFAEYEVGYQCLKPQYQVGAYFLTKLLNLECESEFDSPSFTMEIQNPHAFWHELKIKFMSSSDIQEQRKILMTMCVLYRAHHEQITVLKSLPYWLKLIEQPEYEHCHFILLQLVHVALSVKGSLAKLNLQKFIKANGLLILHNCMNYVFKELCKTQQATLEQDQMVRASQRMNTLSNITGML